MAQVISLQTTIESKSKACVGCCPEPIKGFPFFIPPNATMLAAALIYARFGWPVFPVVPKYKVPYAGSHGHLDANTDPVRIRRWWIAHPDSMIGVPMGSRSGVFCVDLDRKPGEPDGVATWAQITADREAAPTMSNISPSTGQHHLFQHVEGVRSLKLNALAPGVEIKGEGGFVVMPPSRGYVWNTPLLVPAPAPDWLVNDILAICAPPKFAPPPSDGEPVSDEKIRGALAVIDPDLDRNSWIHIGCALFKELGDAGFVLWNEWSSKGKKYDLSMRQMERQWKSFAENNGYAYTIGTVFWHANQAQPGWWVEAEEQATARIEAMAAELAEATAKAAAEPAESTITTAESTIAAAESTITAEPTADAAPNDTNTAQPAEPKREPTTGTNGGQEPKRPSAPGDAKWPKMEDAAYHGFAGEVVRAIEPHSEADPVALLLQFLVCFGNIIGRTCYTRRTRARQHGNLFVNMVGQSAIARKGTAYEDIRDVVQFADPMWVEEHIQGGLSSGEGLIFAVRDPIKKWDKTKQEEVEVDPGVSDKRLLVVETELASLLTVMQRSGNTISPLLRNAWDGNKLQTITRKEPLTATNAHISIIGHITEDELRARLTRTDMASGFANRFLFACVRRSKSLPRGNYLSDNDVEQMGEKLKRIIEVVTGDQLSGDPASRLLTMTEAAEAAWAPVYHNWGVERPGLLATLTARAAPQTLRLAMIYALLDRGDQIALPHLQAALAVWNYCEASADHIFGSTMLGDDVADPILNALKIAGQRGMSRGEIYELFGGHQPKWRTNAALRLLAEKGLGRRELQKGTGGRPAEIWFAL